MFALDQFELVDFGGGMKWERFAGVDVVRDCPAADSLPSIRGITGKTRGGSLRFDRKRKVWLEGRPAPQDWQIIHGKIVFSLKTTPFGHLGVFCEQAANWDWISTLPHDLTGLQALNLFGYTGGTTLALADRGANVVHVDAAHNVVQWARSNAWLSGMEASPIRWITDDAVKFVNREGRRGNRYDILVADPPAFGHGGKKMSWKFNRDLEPLMQSLGKILSPSPLAVLMTCHTSGFLARDLARLTYQELGLSENGTAEQGGMELATKNGQKLNCGHFFRWHR